MVTNRYRQRIRGIQQLGELLYREKRHKHLCNLFLRSVTITRNRLLYFLGGVFNNGYFAVKRRRHGHPLGTPQLQHGLYVFAIERGFQGYLVRIVLIYKAQNTFKDLGKPQLMTFVFTQVNNAKLDEVNFGFANRNKPIPHNIRARIQPKDNFFSLNFSHALKVGSIPKLLKLQAMVYGLIVVLLSYCFLVILFTRAWYQAVRQPRPSAGSTENLRLSVVVAARNEAETLPLLLEDLGRQGYPRFDIIIVNDHSTDQTEAIARSHAMADPRITVIASPREGKKHALTAGIAAARGEIIVTIDADCRVGPHWLARVADTFADTTVQFAFGPVRMQGAGTFFSHLQYLEFATLTAAAAATWQLHRPAMCNGANLAFRKDTFHAVEGYSGNLHIPSGDDEFLMRKIAARYTNSIAFINHPGAIVSTQPQPTLNNFIHQRLRWAGKWRHNTSRSTQLLAVYILLVQISLAVLPVWIVAGVVPVAMIALLLGRAGVEAWYIGAVTRFLGVRFSIPAFILLQLVYPFYVVAIGILSFFMAPRWKDRRIPRDPAS